MFKTKETTKPLLKKLYKFILEIDLKTENDMDMLKINYNATEFGIGPNEAFEVINEKLKSQLFKKHRAAKSMDIIILDAKLLAE